MIRFLVSNEASAPAEVCPAGGALQNSSAFRKPPVLARTENYTELSSPFQGL